jgi:integrase/recombinase XerD
MANSTVTLMLRIRTADGKRPFVKPVYSANGRIRQHYAVVKGQAEHHPESSYFLRYAEGEKRYLEPVGAEATAALAAKLRREHIQQAKILGVEVVDDRKGARDALADAMAKYLLRVRVHKSGKTQNEYDYMLPQFAKSCNKMYLDQITAEDLLLYMQELREAGLSARTIHNRVGRVSCFLKANGIVNLLAPNERPRFDQKVVEAYSVDELKALFSAASKDERLLFQFFLGSGCREAEVAYATWRDVDFSNKTFTVHSKRKLGFGPKDREERVIPLPDSLVGALLDRRRTHQGGLYIFPNRDGKPNGHQLRILKRLAMRAGLSCGECTNRKGLSCKD